MRITTLFRRLLGVTSLFVCAVTFEEEGLVLRVLRCGLTASAIHTDELDRLVHGWASLVMTFVSRSGQAPV